MNIAPLRKPQADPHDAPIQRLGRLVEQLPGALYRIECEDGTWQCRRAASCLLRPEAGDTVLIAGPDRYHVYLIAVIDQANPGAARIEADGDLTLAAPAGGVRVESARFALDTAEADCRVDRVRYTGAVVEAMAARIRVVGQLCESVMDRLVHLSRSAFRLVEQTEQVRAGRIDYEAEGLARVHARQTVVTAQAVVKVDGQQIHMG